jgi:hypothetical protein
MHTFLGWLSNYMDRHKLGFAKAFICIWISIIEIKVWAAPERQEFSGYTEHTLHVVLMICDKCY